MCAYLSVLLKLNVQQEVSIPKYKKYGKLAVAVHVLQIPKTLSFQVIVLQGTAKNCKIYNASVQRTVRASFNEAPTAIYQKKALCTLR